MDANDSHDGSDSAAAEKSGQRTSTEDLANRSPADLERNAGDIKQEADDETPANDESPPITKLLFIGIGIWCAIFLVSLDQTIVSNAIPSITDEFQKVSDIGWYGSGYLLTTSAFQLFYGRVYANFSVKYTFLGAICIFELGSLICGLAPTSTALIVGRAVAGLGGAGIASGAMTIIALTVPVHIRPIFIGLTGAVFAVASVLGPVVGGIFTTQLTWRWCFYINLPFGGVTILTILLLIRLPDRPELRSLTLTDKLRKIDIIGLLVFIPAITCLLLALQWGGSMYPWNDGRIIALFVLFGVLGLSFLAFEYWKGPDATLPIRMVTRRSMAAATWNAFCNGAAFMLLIYYVPFWHQVIRDVSAAQSGISLLPLVLGVITMVILSGALVTRIGYYTIMMILSSIIAPIGEGLLTTWTVNTSFSQWVGYQALTGIGIGLGQQQPMIAAQTILTKEEVPSGTSIIMLVQTMSGAIFTSVGQTVLQNELLKNLKATLPPGDFDPSHLINAGATQVRSIVPPAYLQPVLVAYNGALTKVFTVGLCMSTLTIIGSLTMEWKSVKKAKEASTDKTSTGGVQK